MKTHQPLIESTKELQLLYIKDQNEANDSSLQTLKRFFDHIHIHEPTQLNIQHNKIDLIIIDLAAPKTTRFELIRKLKEQVDETPILILSEHNETIYFQESIQLGIEGYLLKPLNLDQLCMVLTKVVEKIKLKHDLEDQLYLFKQYQDATDHSAIVSKTDAEGFITYVNEEFSRISGYSKEELIGRNHNIIRHPDNPDSLFEKMWNTIRKQKKIWKGIIRNMNKAGKSYYVNSTIKPILDIQGNIIEYIALRDDVTDIMNPKQQFNDAVLNAKEPLVIYMKLEDYATLEDFYDNQSLEQIEHEIACYFEEKLPQHYNFEKVFDLGRGEYALVSEKQLCLYDKEAFFEDIKNFQQKVHHDHLILENFSYDISVIISIGYDDDKVIESVKLGLKQLLQTKRNFIVANELASKEQEKARKNIQTINMVKKSLNDSKIISYFQPIVHNESLKVEKYESLVRLVNEENKVLSPFFFLDVAKKGKYYSKITNRVLENSFEALGKTDSSISINISALDIEHPITQQRIRELINEYSHYRSRIIFELLEDESVKDFDVIKNFISDVKAQGIRIAIDDFGAGYSNFERLLNYQPDILKIDGSLTRNIDKNDYSLSVVKTIVAFAKDQNIETVAEFVENKEIFNILKELGIDYSQGYYFGEPKPL